MVRVFTSFSAACNMLALPAVCDPPHRLAELGVRSVGVAAGGDYQEKYADETADELAFYPRVTMQVHLVAHVRIAQSERRTYAQYDEADRGIDRNGRQELIGDDLGRVPHIADERHRADRGDEKSWSLHEITQLFVRNAQQGNADTGKRERAVRRHAARYDVVGASRVAEWQFVDGGIPAEYIFRRAGA